MVFFEGSELVENNVTGDLLLIITAIFLDEKKVFT